MILMQIDEDKNVIPFSQWTLITQAFSAPSTNKRTKTKTKTKGTQKLKQTKNNLNWNDKVYVIVAD